MSDDELVCWKCGSPLTGLPLPLSRLAECPKCRAFLHACRLCVHYDPRLTRRCREERAEEVRDPEIANFCDWFKPRPGAHRPPAVQRAQAAKGQLDALFGGAGETPADTAREQLERLLGGGGKPEK